MCCHTPPRRGFTLIELLVVIFILAFLFGLLVYFYPSYSAKQKMVTASNYVTGLLIRAKQQAKRDNLPTGVRCLVTGTSSVELQLIQQPDPFPAGRVTQVTNNGTTATVVISANLQPGGVDPLLAVGDYLDINGGGRLHQVLAVSPSTVTTVTVDVKDANTPATQSFSSTAGAGSNYRIFAQPRPMAGEGTTLLPATTQINLSLSQIVPRGGFYDILFSPNGGVVNQAPTYGSVLLYIADTDPVSAATGGSLIVATQLRSGAIGVFPAGPAAAPYQFVTPGRSSGM
jgi:prepilin-type N-terminal cleavage/methylation domain-containing protein